MRNFSLFGDTDLLEERADDSREFNSPYKLCIFILITEIEKAQQIGSGFDVDVHAFLGVFVTFLIRQEHLSLFSLKCFIARFIEPLSPSLAENFFKSVHLRGQIGFTPNSEALSSSSRNTNFAWPKSIIGTFFRKVQMVSDNCDLLGQDEFNRYAQAQPTREELDRMKNKWRFDLTEFSKRISESEEKFLDVVC